MLAVRVDIRRITQGFAVGLLAVWLAVFAPLLCERHGLILNHTMLNHPQAQADDHAAVTMPMTAHDHAHMHGHAEHTSSASAEHHADEPTGGTEANHRLNPHLPASVATLTMAFVTVAVPQPEPIRHPMLIVALALHQSPPSPEAELIPPETPPRSM